MNVNWLIESNCFEDQKKVAEEVVRQGMICKSASYRPFEPEHGYLSLFKPTDCVIYFGSLAFAAQIRKEMPSWKVYASMPEYDCTKYYPHLAEYLLNERYIMLPYGELHRQKDFLYESLGIDDALFIRPNRGDKIFTGKLLYKEHYDKDVDHLGFYDVQPHELVVVAEPRNIEAEWRFIVVDKCVIDGSQYQLNGKSDLAHNWPSEAGQLAQVVASKYEPDKAWCVDICRTKAGNFRLLEIGCFSCAGLYACDIKTVVRQISQASLDKA